MKHIIFDFDGTIANSSIVFMNGWNQFADIYGYLQVNEKDIELARNMTLHESAKKFQFPMYKMPIILPKIYGYFKEHIHEISPYDGMKEVLQTLQDLGFQLYILSSNDKSNIESFLQLQGITSISEVFTSNKIFGKDRVLKKMMKQRQIAKEDIFYIGDELRDLEACNKCQIDFGWASWGLQGYEVLAHEKPKLLFDSPQHIVELLQQEKVGN